MIFSISISLVMCCRDQDWSVGVDCKTERLLVVVVVDVVVDVDVVVGCVFCNRVVLNNNSLTIFTPVAFNCIMSPCME